MPAKAKRIILTNPAVRSIGWYIPTSVELDKIPNITISTQCIMIPIAETSINGIENLKISLFTSVFIRFLKLIFAKFLKNFNIKNKPIIAEATVGIKIDSFVPRK